jgi:hypothetical protein
MLITELVIVCRYYVELVIHGYILPIQVISSS